MTFYDHGVWVDIPADQLLDDDDEPVIAWNITWKRNSWFSLGVHIDHKWPMVELHLPGVIIRIGRQDHWRQTRGLQSIK